MTTPVPTPEEALQAFVWTLRHDEATSVFGPSFAADLWESLRTYAREQLQLLEAALPCLSVNADQEELFGHVLGFYRTRVWAESPGIYPWDG